MSLIPFAVLWLGLALLFTFALCRVARGPIPKSGSPDQARASRANENKSQST